MFKKDSVQAIAMVLIATVSLGTTGAVEAAMTDSDAVVTTQSVVGWAPLTDAEMSEINAGLGFWALVGVAVVAALITCVIIETVKYAFTPNVEEYDVVDETPGPSCVITVIIIYAEEGETPNLETCPVMHDLTDDEAVDAP